MADAADGRSFAERLAAVGRAERGPLVRSLSDEQLEEFPALEDELCGLLRGGGYEGPGRSPDRADALVWAMSELMLGKARVEARVRVL